MRRVSTAPARSTNNSDGATACTRRARCTKEYTCVTTLQAKARTRACCIIEGIPAGLKVSEEQINIDLARRQSGYGRGGRQKIERDTVQVISGIRFGRTMGSPVA